MPNGRVHPILICMYRCSSKPAGSTFAPRLLLLLLLLLLPPCLAGTSLVVYGSVSTTHAKILHSLRATAASRVYSGCPAGQPTTSSSLLNDHAHTTLICMYRCSSCLLAAHWPQDWHCCCCCHVLQARLWWRMGACPRHMQRCCVACVPLLLAVCAVAAQRHSP
jgi:hypothetical protein